MVKRLINWPVSERNTSNIISISRSEHAATLFGSSRLGNRSESARAEELTSHLSHRRFAPLPSLLKSFPRVITWLDTDIRLLLFIYKQLWNKAQITFCFHLENVLMFAWINIFAVYALYTCTCIWYTCSLLLYIMRQDNYYFKKKKEVKLRIAICRSVNGYLSNCKKFCIYI